MVREMIIMNEHIGTDETNIITTREKDKKK